MQAFQYRTVSSNTIVQRQLTATADKDMGREQLP